MWMQNLGPLHKGITADYLENPTPEKDIRHNIIAIKGGILQ